MQLCRWRLGYRLCNMWYFVGMTSITGSCVELTTNVEITTNESIFSPENQHSQEMSRNYVTCHFKTWVILFSSLISSVAMNSNIRNVVEHGNQW